MSHILEEVRKANNPARQQTNHLTVSADNIGELMNNLTNLYADPAAGCFRETLSNALDSHHNFAQNTEQMIEVTTPYRNSYRGYALRHLIETVTPGIQFPKLENVYDYDFTGTLTQDLIIRDYGTGMSREQLQNNFLSYGNGTKKNDKKQVGGFGYGGKSPLAVATSFHVVSVQDGLKNAFVVSRDPDDSSIPPSFDWDSGMEDGPVETTDQDGVTITVSYESTGKYWEPSLLNLVGLPSGVVSLDGIPWNVTLDNEDLFDKIVSNGEIVGYIAKNETVMDSLGSKNVMYVTVNNIVYPVTDTKNSYGDAYNELRYWESTVILKAPKQGVKFTPSRDDFIYNELTRTTIMALANEVHGLVVDNAQNEINKIDNKTAVINQYLAALAINQPGIAEMTYRDQGVINKVLSEVEFKGIKYGTVYGDSHYSYVPAKWAVTEINHHDFRNLSKFHSLFDGLTIFQVNGVIDETLVKGVRRYFERIVQSSGENITHRKVFVMNSKMLDLNPWVKAVLSENLFDYDTILATTKANISADRKAQREAAKANGVAVTTKTVKPALFVTATPEKDADDMLRARFTGHFVGKPSDLPTGDNFYYADSIASSVNNFSMIQFADAPEHFEMLQNRNWLSKFRLALEVAASEGATLVVLSSRQNYETMVAKFGAGKGKIEDKVDAYAAERVVYAPLPTLVDMLASEADFRGFFNTHTDYYHFTSAVQELRNIHQVFTKFYADNDAVLELNSENFALMSMDRYELRKISAYAAWDNDDEFAHYNKQAKVTLASTPGVAEAVASITESLKSTAQRFALLTAFSAITLSKDGVTFAEVQNMVNFANSK